MHPLSVGKGCTGRTSHVARHGTCSCVSCQLSVVHMPGGMASNNCNLHTFQESVCTGEYMFIVLCLASNGQAVWHQ